MGYVQRRLSDWTSHLRRSENQLTIVLSIVIGALVGLVIVAFIVLTGQLSVRMYPPGGAGWRRILVPTLGSLVTGFLLWRFFPFARGSGIPQTKAAIAIDGKISLRTVIGKFLCCSTSLASGVALGREGPSVQIGAGIASAVGRKAGLSGERLRAIVPLGCAAALAAAFNTPIAAVLFTLEEILGDLHAPILGTVVLSSATSWMVLHLLLGDEPLFHVAGYRLLSPWEFAIYVVLGIVGGFGSVAFVKLILWLRLQFARLPKQTVWLQPALGGLAVGLMGFFVPEVMGVGYNYVEKVLNGDVVLGAVVLLAVLKLIATPMCYSSGNAGGVFGPSLFIGAMMGAVVGGFAHHWFPAWTAGPGAYALVGMGTAFAGIIRTPLTSVIMIFEITRDYSIIVPLMISNLIAYYISWRLQREPIYEALAHQDGIHLPTVDVRLQATKSRIEDVMRPPHALPAETSVAEALAFMSRELVEAWPVVEGDRYAGMIRRADLGAALPGDSIARLVNPDLAEHLHPDHNLHITLERLGASHADVLPVVSRASSSRLVGIAVLDDVLNAYGIARRINPA